MTLSEFPSCLLDSFAFVVGFDLAKPRRLAAAL
jgi:hypothetical protein